jgi:hypothetical protein
MSIDDATPEDWNNLRVKVSDQYRLFPTKDEPEMLGDLLKEDYKLAEEKMKDSYTRQGYKFKTSWGDDAVDSPAHYNSGDIECIDSIQAMLTPDEFIGYLRGNSHKYRWRFRYKNKPIEDLRKARWYEDRLMKYLMENQDVLG